MASYTRSTFLGIVIFGWLAHPGAVPALASAVKDKAQLFPRAARRQADAEAREIRRQYGVDLVIETFKPTPKSFFARLWSRKGEPSQDDRRTQFGRWAQEREAAQAAKSVYLLIDKAPGLVQVEIKVGGDPHLQEVFTQAKREELGERLAAALRQEHADQGLSAAVDFVRSTLAERLGPPQPAFDWLEVVWLIVPILAAWLLLEGLRRTTGSGGSEVQAGPDAWHEGGAASHLAGLFATMAAGDFRAFLRRGACPEKGSTGWPGPHVSESEAIRQSQ